MANMSYCRFENTLSDLQDCADALYEGKPLSGRERECAKELIRLCKEIADDFESEDLLSVD